MTQSLLSHFTARLCCAPFALVCMESALADTHFREQPKASVAHDQGNNMGDEMVSSAEFFKGGQRGFFHDEGNPSGFFHTYDQFKPTGYSGPERKIHVYVPRDYEMSNKQYPVVYANDGGVVFFPGGLVNKSWNLASRLDERTREGRPFGVIVVGIHPLNRDKEYTHAPVFSRDFGGLWEYTRYLSETVKPWIDLNYRTSAEASATTIMGSSHDGLAAFAAAASYPQSFGNVIAMSPSFWVGLDAPPPVPPMELGQSELIQRADPTLSQRSNMRPRIYLDWGLVRSGGRHNSFTEERATARGREMAGLLQNNYGYTPAEQLFVVEDPEGEHNEESWSKRVTGALDWALRSDERDGN